MNSHARSAQVFDVPFNFEDEAAATPRQPRERLASTIEIEAHARRVRAETIARALTRWFAKRRS